MCGGGGGSVPPTPDPLPQAPQAAPSRTGTSGAAFRQEVAKRRGASFGDTLVTGPRGLTDEATTKKKTLLGS